MTQISTRFAAAFIAVFIATASIAGIVHLPQDDIAAIASAPVAPLA